MPVHSHTYSHVHTHSPPSHAYKTHTHSHTCALTHVYNTHAHTPLQTRTFTHLQLPPHAPGLYPFSTKLFSPSVNILQKRKVISLFPICKRNVFSLFRTCSVHRLMGFYLGLPLVPKPQIPLCSGGVSPLSGFPVLIKVKKEKSPTTRMSLLPFPSVGKPLTEAPPQST